ncbi:hypothetical protein ACIF8W_03865 [Streptomyces sp. NPDC085639]|uniref:hypothetical protein n=1 Tax=Streptomyces sp. NPDC085639 TaxID=3365734 RepID=UPI0037D27B0C
MIFPLSVDRILADRSRAECGRSAITVPAPGGAHVVLGGPARSRLRHGPHAIFRYVPRPPCTCDCPWGDDGDCDCHCTCPECVVGAEEEVWLTTVDASPVGDGTDLAFPAAERCRRGFPWSWEPGGTHYGGPGVWVGEADLVMATVRHDGRVGLPKQGSVVRRPIGEAATGTPAWMFPVDRTPIALDSDPSTDTVLVALSSGELIALDAATGTPRARGYVHVRGVPSSPPPSPSPAPDASSWAPATPRSALPYGGRLGAGRGCLRAGGGPGVRGSPY